MFNTFIINAQTDITAATTIYSNSVVGKTYSGPFAIGGNSTYSAGTFQYNFGANASTTNNVLSLQSFATATNSYIPVATNPTIIFKRNSTNPNNSILFFKGATTGPSGSFANVFNMERPYEEAMEVVFSGLNNFNAGTDNIFTNVGDGNSNNNNIERVDVVFNSPRVVLNAAKEGIAVFERGELNSHDGFKIAIIKTVNGSNDPTNYYTNTKTIINGSYGNTNLITSSSDVDYYIFRKPIPSANDLRVSAFAQQNMGGVFLKFSDFGILNNEIVIGYSILPEDVVVTNGGSVLNYNNVTTPYLTNTNNSDGGLDLVAVTAIYQEGAVAALNEMELTAYTEQNQIKLEWKNSNSDLNSMEVQKSTDGFVFNNIHTATVNTTHEYQYADFYKDAINFYRIEFKNIQGNISYSNIVKIITTNKNESFQLLSSNPVQGNDISLKIKAVIKQDASVTIYNCTGQLLAKKMVTLQKGDNFITVDKVKNFKGIAILSVKVDGERINKQLLF